MTTQQGSNLVMILGGATAVGRLMFGKIVEWGYLNRVHMHQLSMVITGTACMFLPVIRSFVGLVCYVVLAGLVDGCYVVLLPVLTTQLVGLENRVMAWGFLVAMSSVTFTLGPPIAGTLFVYVIETSLMIHRRNLLVDDKHESSFRVIYSLIVHP